VRVLLFADHQGELHDKGGDQQRSQLPLDVPHAAGRAWSCKLLDGLRPLRPTQTSP